MLRNSSISLILLFSVFATSFLVLDSRFTTAQSSGDVGMFRGNETRSGVMPGPGPRSAPRPLWSFETGSSVRSSPIVAEGNVYVGADDGYVYGINGSTGEALWKTRLWESIGSSAAFADGTLYIGDPNGVNENFYAIDATTGKKLWRIKLGDGVRSSPVVSGNTVFVGSKDAHLYAIDAETGTERWRFQTSGIVDSSPAVANGIVYFGSMDSNVYAVDVASGVELWHFQTGGYVTSTPAVIEDTLWVGSWDSFVYAIDAVTGVERWKFQTGDRVESSPAVDAGTVYVGSLDANLYAIDGITGSELWRFQTGIGIYSSPAVVDDTVYFGGLDRTIYAVEALTGNERWRYQTGDEIRSSPAVVDGIVYIGSGDHSIYAVTGDASAGVPVTNTPVPTVISSPTPNPVATSSAATPTGAIEDEAVTSHFRGGPSRTGEMPGPGPESVPQVIWSHPIAGADDQSVIAGDTVFVVGGGIVDSASVNGLTTGTAVGIAPELIGRLYAFDVQTGAVRWEYYDADWSSLGDRLEASGPVVVGNQLFFVGVDGHIHSVDRETGAKLWESETQFIGTPAVAYGTVFIVTVDGALCAIDATTGIQTWTNRNINFAAGHPDSYHAPTVSDGRVFAIGRAEGGPQPNTLIAVDATSGSALWRNSGSSTAYTTTPVVVNGVVYVRDYGISAIDAQTGEFLWRSLVGTNGPAFSIDPGDINDLQFDLAVGEGVIFGSDRFGTVTAIDAATGVGLWSFDTETYAASSLAIADGMLFISAPDGTIYSLSGKNGWERSDVTVEWSLPTSYSSAALTISNGIIYVSTIVGGDFVALGNLTP